MGGDGGSSAQDLHPKRPRLTLSASIEKQDGIRGPLHVDTDAANQFKKVRKTKT